MLYTVPQLTDFSTESLAAAKADLLSALEQESAALEQEWATVTPAQLEAYRNRWTTRKNVNVNQAKEFWLNGAPKEAKREAGLIFNEIFEKVQERVQSTADYIADRHLLRSNTGEAASVSVDEKRLDITLPGTRRPLGAEHPVIRTMHEIVSVFRNLGYSIEEGPEIETDYYNFEALNFPPNHPARDTQDTLFIAGQESKAARERLLLRTHTSPVQIRAMMKQKPPVRVLCPGKVHRNDAADATHSPVFHQVEGLAVDAGITFCDLKGTLDHAMKSLFGSGVKTRFYPSFFPFTEPSADMQISCIFCNGKGQRDGGPCRNCKSSGWIELLGCGMVDPNVYKFVDYDATKVSGLAFGMGVERIAIMKYGVDDIQLFYNGDVRFLEQFA